MRFIIVILLAFAAPAMFAQEPLPAPSSDSTKSFVLVDEEPVEETQKSETKHIPVIPDAPQPRDEIVASPPHSVKVEEAPVEIVSLPFVEPAQDGPDGVEQYLAQAQSDKLSPWPLFWTYLRDIFIPIITVLALLGTVIYARKSALAASRSADAAIKMAYADRAWLIINFRRSSATGPAPLHATQVYFEIRNSGKSPAILKGVMAELYWIPDAFPEGRELAPDNAEAIKARSKRRPQIVFTNSVGRPMKVVRILEANAMADQMAAQESTDLTIEANEGQSLTAIFHWPERPSLRHTAFFWCRLFYEDIRGLECETSLYIRISETGSGMDLADKGLKDAYNYRK